MSSDSSAQTIHNVERGKEFPMPSWRDKLQDTRNAAEKLPELAIVFAVYDGADDEFLKQLEGEFPFVIQEYLDFLRSTDGAQLDMCLLFGSGKSGRPSIQQAIRRWRPIVAADGLAIGEDSSGDAFVLARDGQVRLVNYRLDGLEEGKLLAESFSQFLADVLMGPLFPTLFPRGFAENEWTCYLRRQRWL